MSDRIDTEGMTVEQARDIVSCPHSSELSIQQAILVLTLSDWIGDQMVALELRKARMLVFGGTRL